jgi:HAD superfamily hydrolase (TIGR01509 family)
MIKAVIFDLDGVIADSEPLSAQADDIILSRYGIRKTEREKRDAYGRRFEEIYRDLLGARKMHMDIEKLGREKLEAFGSLVKNNLKPVKNSIELVEFLGEAGFRLALATSSQFEKMDLEVRELGIESLFGTVVTGEMIKKGKPDPEIFLKAAELIGTRPAECAVIEDSAFGVQAAKRAGMFAIGFRSPNSPGQDMSSADIVVDDLDEVKGYFGGGQGNPR